MEVCYIEPGKKYKPSIIALGNFDGVHLGHRKLLECGLEKAKELNVRLCVLLFDPHPFKILYPDKKLNLLTTTLEKLRLFSDMGVEKVFLLQFTSEVAKTSPKDFTCRIIKDLGAVHVVVGFNYSFGAKGIGKPQDLEGLGKECGFGVSIIQAQKIDDMVISSSEIRRFLLNGEIASAKKMLGRAPSISGKVVHGDKRGGRVLGFPTANISLDEDLIVPKNGVYAVSSTINGRNVWGMMNIGYRPTFNSRPDKSIEVNFLDFEGDLYDKNLTINIHEKLRSEKKFSAIEEMIAQLNKDKENVIKLYKSSQMS